MYRNILYLTILTSLAACSTQPAPPVYKTLMSNADRIQPYAQNPFYWQYKSAPVLLLGGSVEDNLFQIADIEDQLDLLHSLGGNYVRCTMSSRDEGDAWDLQSTQHPHAEEHWQNPQLIRQYIIDSGHIRPMNSVIIYGANTGRFGTHRDAQERLWRNVFGGLASCRFHRPEGGLGLSKIAQAHIRSLRDLTERIDIFTCTPNNDLLDARSANEAYCTAKPGIEYAVFFPDGGNVVLATEARREI